MVWPFDSKNFRKVERISEAFMQALGRVRWNALKCLIRKGFDYRWPAPGEARAR